MVRSHNKPQPRGKKQYKRFPMKKKLDAAVVKRRKNVKSIQRAKEMQEQHRKQRLIEDKYLAETKPNVEMDLGLSGDDISEGEESPYNNLLAVLNAPKELSALVTDTEEEEEEETENDYEGEESDSDLSGEEEEEGVVMEELGETAIGSNSSDISSNGEEQENNKSCENSCDTIVNDANNPAEKLKKVRFETTDECHDAFSLRLNYELSEKSVEKLLARNDIEKKTLTWPEFGEFLFELPSVDLPTEVKTRIETLYSDLNKSPKLIETDRELRRLGIKESLINRVPLPLSDLQSEVLTVVTNYQDLFYPKSTFETASQLRFSYCLHALNHTLLTRSRIIHHNEKLKAAAAATNGNKAILVPDRYRDQGLTRPKVLFLLPFRQSAFQVVDVFRRLLFGEMSPPNAVMHFERFTSEYTGRTLHLSKTNPKPLDYERMFTGNTDDNFRLGLSLTKKSLKLYTDFYGSDILIASPLGLRMVVGAPGSAERDYDFLNSVELLIIDQADILYAQNWDTVQHIIDHLHLQPQQLHDTDFQRVRPWCLNGLGKYYRQSLIFSNHELPEFRALFNSKCLNYAGRARPLTVSSLGVIRNTIVPITQTFLRVDVGTLTESFDQRFNYFVKEILPRLRGPSHAHCLVYVPSYFDFVRLRNYLKAESISFVQICEYTNKAKIARARDLFYHSGAHFMLYSERSHFYRRTRLKGIRHLVMYQPPNWPHFYSEMVNLMQNANQNSHDGLDDSMSITVLYTKYDLLQVNAIIGSTNTGTLLRSPRNLHIFSPE